jgi:hypothetical protein
MVYLTKEQKKEALALLKVRTGSTFKKKLHNQFKDAARNRKKVVSFDRFKKLSMNSRKNADITGVDDGKDSTLYAPKKQKKDSIEAQLKEPFRLAEIKDAVKKKSEKRPTWMAKQVRKENLEKSREENKDKIAEAAAKRKATREANKGKAPTRKSSRK